MTGAKGRSPKVMLGSLWMVAREGRGLLYAIRAISVKPATRRVRSAAVVSQGGANIASGVDSRTVFHYLGTWVPV